MPRKLVNEIVLQLLTELDEDSADRKGTEQENKQVLLRQLRAIREKHPFLLKRDSQP